jgi:hypothetical protein
MASDSDYYSVLHVRSDAPTEIIRASYRALMQALRLHPDLGGSTEQAALINQAYRVLSNKALRAQYDRTLEAEAGSRTETGTRSGNRTASRTDQQSRREADPGPQPESRRSANPCDGRDSEEDPDPFAETAPGDGEEPGWQRCLYCANTISTQALEVADAVCGRCASPLARATRHRLERSTRRMLRRTERRIPVRACVRFGAPAIEGMVLNLSLNGLLFESAHEFEPNQLIRIDTELLKSLARITHCRRNGDRSYATGVEFVTILFNSTRGTFVSERA